MEVLKNEGRGADHQEWKEKWFWSLALA